MKRCFCGNDRLLDYSEGYYRCSDCNTLISKHDFSRDIYEVTNEAEDLYGKHYWQQEMLQMAGMGSTDELIDFYLKERCAYWCKYIVRYIRPESSVAESGCGLGQLLYVLKNLGYKVKGFELSGDICQYVEAELKVPMHHGELLESREKYDAILGFDLIEHMIEPEKFLRDCREKVGESGIICFQTPCYDPLLSYEEMLQIKPRFREQLKEEQHVYLYSRESMKKLLMNCGFPYIQFEPAYFGDEYDMFFFASASPLQTCEGEEWNRRMNEMPGGRIVKALISLEEQNRLITKRFNESQKDSKERLKNINILTEQLKKTQEDSAERLKNNDILTEQLLATNADVEEKESVIQELRRQLVRCQMDSEERLKNAETLAAQLEECREDSAQRLHNMEILEQLLADQQKQCQEKEHVIQEQLVLIHKLEEQMVRVKNENSGGCVIN